MAATPAPNEPSDQRQTFIHFAQTPDHLYLAPAFYTKADHVTCPGDRPQHILLTHINGKSPINGHSTIHRPNSVESQGNEEDELVAIPFGHSIASSQSELYDDDLDEDSNDTRSCSSSSGCSSSSNSMVGSVNRHLTLGNGNLTQRTPNITSTITTSSQNGAISSASLSQYKDLTPKQVKRRLDWDSAPETPLVAKHTMTAVNGKPVSVRTFKLSNAMKQSLVAAGCSNAVAVAAVHATSGSPVGANTHQSPTTIAIVNGPSSKSTTPTVHTIVTSNHSPLGTGATPSSTCPQTPQVIFKTPLAPKLSTNSVSPNQPSQTTQVFIVNKSGSLEQPTAVVNGKNNIRLTPILASSVSVGEPVKVTNGVKRARLSNSAKLNGVTPDPVPTHNLATRTPKSNGVRVRHDSLDNNSLDSPCFLSSPFNGNNDMSSTTGLYSSSSYPCSPSSCSSSEYSTGRRSSGRTRYETSLGQLTRKFIQMLQESNEGSLNLNDASEVLQVQKRRIYDITNVLEGVGLLHKTSKNSIQWRGGVLDYCAGRASSEQVDQSSHYRNRKPPPLSLLFGDQADHKGSIEDELIDLENDENRLDNLIGLANSSLNQIKAQAKSFLYASYMDLRQVPEFKDQTVIGIRPPMDTTLEVPDPSESLQIRLKNTRREMIEVYLCPRMSEDEEQNKYSGIYNHDQLSHIQSAAPLTNKLKTNVKSEPTEETNLIPLELNSSPHSDMPLINSESGYNSGFGTRSMVSGHSEQSKLLNASNSLGSLNQTAMTGQQLFSPHSSAIDVDRSFSSVLDDFESHPVKSEPLSNGHDQYSSYAHSAFLSQDDGFSLRTPHTYMGQSHEDHLALKSSIEASGHADPSHYQNQALNHSSIFSSPLALIPLDPPVTDDDYNFTLSDHEGIAELFDDDFSLVL